MAVESIRSPQVSYIPIGIAMRARPLNNQLQANASKAAFNTSMERAQMSQSYWDELLEKLRKAGGGGGGGNDKSFDRIAVSMMLSNFLSNKTIQAMLSNFGVELFNPNTANQTNNTNQAATGNMLYIFSSFATNVVNLFIVTIGKITGPENTAKASTALSLLIGNLSFQMNKLKEILEENLKELIKKLDVKEKMKKIKTILTDLFVELKDELISTLKSFTEKIFSHQLKQVPNELYNALTRLNPHQT